MSEVSKSNKALYRTLVSEFRNKSTVTCFWDDNKRSSVDILECRNSPQSNVVSYGTLGLSDHKLLENGKDAGLRAEFVAACGARSTKFANIVATAAFCIINSRWSAYPGAVFPDIVGMYSKKSKMRHLLLTSPFLWPDLKTQYFDDKTVAWLMLVPISEEEYRFTEKSGSDALEKLFVEKQIDVYNLNRTSVC